MASANNSKKYLYIYELPYEPLIQLSHILDIDDQWKNLGGIHMGFDFTTLQLMERAFQRGKSPTLELFERWGDRNGTVKNLFLMLLKMRNQRALLVLKPFVDEKYYKYIHSGDDTITLTDFRSSFIDSKSTISSKHSIHSHSKSSCISKHRNTDQAYASSSSSKYQNDMNMNQNISTPSLASKMNEMSVSDNHCRNVKPSEKRSPDLHSNKKDVCDNSRVESVTDNCAQVKMKNVRKLSLPHEILLNGRPSHIACGSNLSMFDETLPNIMQISYKDLCKATDNFNKSRILGKGGFGTVYKGDWRSISVAIKRLTPRDGHDSASQQLVSLKQSFNEFQILNRCRFDHILSLYGVSLDGVVPCLVYQLMVNGSLEDWLVCRKTPPLTWSQRSHIAECTTKGLNYLHTAPGKPLIHGDIKSANILLDNNMDAKIGDFGLTREMPGYDNTHVKVSSLHGTECYLPDEYLRHRHLSPQVDIYSYGIVLLEMATGLRPYDPKRGEAKLLVNYVSDCSTSGRLESLRDVKAGEENMRWFRELLEIGQKCCSKEKKKRPPMQEVLDQFDKIKEEMSTFDKIRRLSNDKGTVSIGAKMLEDTEIRKLSPIQLQKVYDMLNNDLGPSKANEHFEDSLPQNKGKEIVDPSCSKDVNGLAENNNLNDIRSHSSHIETVESSLFSANNTPDPPAASVPNPDTSSNPKDNPSQTCTPPMPLITILQMQISEFNDTNNTVDDEYIVSNASSNLISD